MGLIVLGIFAFTQQSLQGSTLQMLNHGLSTGALFLLVGMIYERRHTARFPISAVWRIGTQSLPPCSWW